MTMATTEAEIREFALRNGGIKQLTAYDNTGLHHKSGNYSRQARQKIKSEQLKRRLKATGRGVLSHADQ